MKAELTPVPPLTGHPETVVGEDQPRYRPLTVALFEMRAGEITILTRWTLTPAQRAQIAEGEDIYVTQLNFGESMTPMAVLCGPGPYLKV